MLYFFKSIHIGINKAITREDDCLLCVCFVLLFLPWALVFLGLLQYLVHCDKSQRMEATIITKSFILYLIDSRSAPEKLR